MAKVCIICTEEASSGSPVADDAVIRSIRKAKQALNIAKNNELVVCGKDLEAHMKKRQKYERNLALYMVLAGLVLVLLVFVPVFTTGFSLSALIIGVLLAALLVALPVITSHTPALASAASAAKGWRQGQKGKTFRGKAPGRRR
jgi:predicted nucleic acid-binding Zn ribbon protein